MDNGPIVTKSPLEYLIGDTYIIEQKILSSIMWSKDVDLT
jgi:hypothetical protein